MIGLSFGFRLLAVYSLMVFKKKLFPVINGTIPVNKEAFLAGLKDETTNTSHEHLNLRIKVEVRENDLSIKTARRIPHPLDHAILHGAFRSSDNFYYFDYAIRPRKIIFALIPWFALVLIFAVCGVIIAVTLNLVGLLFAGFCAFAFIYVAKYFIKNYQNDAAFLEGIMTRNKKG